MTITERMSFAKKKRKNLFMGWPDVRRREP
jgi:hypothetical protein